MEKYRRIWKKPDDFMYLVYYDTFSNINSAYHCHDFYEFFLMMEGSITHNVNAVQHTLSKGDLVLIRPDDYHAFFEDGAVCKYLNLGFSQKTILNFFDFMGLDHTQSPLLRTENPPIQTLSTYQLEHFYDVLEPIKYAFASDYTEAIHLKFKHVLFNMLLLSLQKEKPPQSIEEPKWLTHLIEAMHFQKNFSVGVSKMSVLTGFSMEYIARTFKKHHKITPIQFVTTIRMNYATNSLKYSNEKIIVISENCGFDSVSHFYRVFKKHHGLSPAKYRIMHRNVLT